MINAKIHAELNDNAGLIIEFSDPNGNYKDHPNHFVAVSSHTDLLKRLYFKNRVYICDTLSSFLNQRLHALPSYNTRIEMMKEAINRGRTFTYPALCELVFTHQQNIKSIAPTESSRFYNHFKTVIEPILIECENVHTGKAKVHYC